MLTAHEKLAPATKVTLAKYMNLPTGTVVQAEYVWLGGGLLDIRCKTRTLLKKTEAVEDLPIVSIYNFK
jgi:hypothetical protein